MNVKPKREGGEKERCSICSHFGGVFCIIANRRGREREREREGEI